MTPIEVTLLAISIVLLLILLFYAKISAFLSKIAIRNSTFINKICKTTEKLYNIFTKLRKFSLSYILKNKFQQFYIFIPLLIVGLKISTNHSSTLGNIIPSWMNKSIDFLMVSASWELVCFTTKILDNLFKKFDE